MLFYLVLTFYIFRQQKYIHKLWCDMWLNHLQSIKIIMEITLTVKLAIEVKVKVLFPPMEFGQWFMHDRSLIASELKPTIIYPRDN